jgi:hypothetical protein
MLVGNKFLFLKIPRTATTAFERSCFLANIEVKYPTDKILSQKRAANGQESLRHSHETVSKLREVFGDSYPVVAVRRDDLERFISAWKFFIRELETVDMKAASILREVDNTAFIQAWIKELGYSAELVELEKLTSFTTSLIGYPVKYSANLFYILSATMSGPSRWHQNDLNIKYFDFKNLSELEKYVKETVDPSFEFIISNHTKFQTTKLTPTDDLKEFYYTWVEPGYKKNITLI